MQDSEDLVRKASSGDRPSVDELLVRNLPSLRAFIRLRSDPMIRAKESVSDMVQSVCLDVLNNMSDFVYQGDAAFRAWLFKRALYKIYDKRRFWTRDKRDLGRDRALPAGEGSASYEALYCASVASPSQILIGLEQMQLLERCFDDLSEDHKEVLVLSRIIGLPHREIAEKLDKSETAIRSLLNRARIQLANLLDSRRSSAQGGGKGHAELESS